MQSTSPDFFNLYHKGVSHIHILHSIYIMITILNYVHTRIRDCGVSTFVIGEEAETLFCTSEMWNLQLSDQTTIAREWR
jgi:hypothetical protein